jgi:hypothetical protein
VRPARASALVRLALLSALLWGVSPPTEASDGDGTEVGFVYAEANVGGASGGHAALRLGDVVYSYQSSSQGLLVLTREAWRPFLFRYGALENRPMHVAYPELSQRSARRIRDLLTSEYLAQRSAFDSLASQVRDVELLEALTGARRGVTSRGAGLLDPRRRGAPSALQLKRRVKARLGASFLRAEIERLEEALRSMPILDAILDAAPLADAPGRPAPVRDGSLARHRELLLERAALLAIREAHGLDPTAVLAPESGPDGLTSVERRSLARLADALEDAVVELLGSSRPDRGHPLFVAIARYQVVTRSLEQSRLWLLDPFPAPPPSSEGPRLSEPSDERLARARRTERLYRRARARILGRGSVDEPRYNRLEELGARHLEYRAEALGGRPAREARGRLVPERGRALEPLEVDHTRTELVRALGHARRAERQARERLRERYAYDLLSNNCATAIARVLGEALDGPDRARGGLAAALRARGWLDFVPSALFSRVERASRRIERIPSHRERALARLRADDPRARALVYLREANAFTSTVYRRRDPDGSFLLFTDDVFLPRPLYGALNLGLALADGGAGLLTAPFDGGRRARRAARGALFSLPELVFFNVRKGSFGLASLEDGWAHPPPAVPTGAGHPF